MAIRFRPLPLDVFTEAQRPYIAHMNTVLRELTALEGVIRQPRSSRRRSDASVTRRAEVQVDVSRITPSISSVVSGQSTVVGRPALIMGTVNTVGSTTTAVSVNSAVALFGTQSPLNDAASAAVGTSVFAARADHVHRFPTSLESAASNSTLSLTDDGADQTLAGSLGQLNIQASNGLISLLGAGGPVWLGMGTNGAASGAVFRMSAGSLVWGSALTIGGVFVVTWNDGTAKTSRSLLSLQYSSSIVNATGQTFTSCNVYGTQGGFGNETVLTGVHSFTDWVNVDLIQRGVRGSGVTVTDSIGVRLQTWPLLNLSAGNYINAATTKMQFPTIGNAIRRGHWLTTTTGNVGTAPTNSEGFYCEDITQGTSRTSYYGEGHTTGAPTNCFTFYAAAHAVGANRYAFYGVSDTLYHGGRFQHAGTQFGMHGATPSSQFGTTGTVSGFATGTSTTLTVDSAFTGNTGSSGYTIGDLIQACKQKGLLAY